MTSEQKLKYIAIEQLNARNFQDALNRADADGYELFSVNNDADGYFYAVMVRKETENE